MKKAIDMYNLFQSNFLVQNMNDLIEYPLFNVFIGNILNVVFYLKANYLEKCNIRGKETHVYM